MPFNLIDWWQAQCLWWAGFFSHRAEHAAAVRRRQRANRPWGEP